MDLDELEALERKATAGPWKNGAHIDEPCALVSVASPMESLLALDRDGMAIFDRADDCAVTAAARNALPEMIRICKAVKAWGEARRACEADLQETIRKNTEAGDDGDWITCGLLREAERNAHTDLYILADSLALSASLAKEG